MGEQVDLAEVAARVGERYGPVARNEVAAAGAEHAAELARYADLLHAVDDAGFVRVAAEAIATSAAAASTRGAQHLHARYAMVRAEALRRHLAAGHAPECGALRLYALAYARAVVAVGLDPEPPRAPACSCGVGEGGEGMPDPEGRPERADRPRRAS